MKNRLAFVCFLWLFALGCSADRAVLDVTVDGVSADMATLEVVPSLAGDDTNWGVRKISSGLTHFRIELPAAHFGLFTIQLTADDSTGCPVAAVRGQVEADTASVYPLSVTLAALPEAGCQLRLSVLGQGAGKIVSDLNNDECRDNCQLVFPFDKTITLSAQADPSSLFFGWSGDCSGTGTCIRTPQQQVHEVRATFVPRNICLVDGLCWQNPRPQGSDLLGVWGASPDRLWAVGAGGTILMWNGSFWSPSGHPPTDQLNGIWGSGADDIWAVGNYGVILHWNGKEWLSWQSPTTRALNAIYGTGASDVYAVGNQGLILHWDGQSWQSIESGTSATLTAVWAIGNEAWFGTEQAGLILQLRSGQVTSQTIVGAVDFVLSLWGSGRDDLWAAGTENRVFHFDGTNWSILPDFDPPYSISDLRYLHAIWGSGRVAVWFGGSTQLLYRYRSSSFETVASTSSSVHAMFGFDQNNVWAVGSGGMIMHWNGSFWDKQTSGISEVLLSGWGSSSNQDWAVSASGGIFLFDGNSWRERARSSSALYEIWGSGPNDVWAVGEFGGISHYNGVLWDAVPSATGATLGAVSGSAPDNVWAGGSAGVIMQWNGTAWNRHDLPRNSLYITGIWSSGPNDVWAIGGEIRGGGFLFHWNGAAWVDYSVPMLPFMTAIGGSSASDIWAVGYDRQDGTDVSFNLVLHWDGSDWYIIDVPDLLKSNDAYRALWAAGPQEAWIAGDGLIVHLRPTGGDRIDSIGNRLLSVWGVPNSSGGQDLFFVGDSGSILRWQR